MWSDESPDQNDSVTVSELRDYIKHLLHDGNKHKFPPDKKVPAKLWKQVVTKDFQVNE